MIAGLIGLIVMFHMWVDIWYSYVLGQDEYKKIKKDMEKRYRELSPLQRPTR